MPIRIFGGHGIVNITTLEEILKHGKAVGEDLATGKRIVADLTKEEKRAYHTYLRSLGNHKM
ncbi:hypothetical protein [Candidatus Aquicultor secundus]|uniref:hypothetical protein n=1 Tax=Candidatus Aquicultor secundus TaxID=1973895 RepID=UPI00090ECAA8|nr:hypothetical protein [Candidatus Aquicultor secundus]OIO61025.1 MAG: hypothetical protein AUJ82_00200 [Verrucomicrobia bacterium CG1_02_43_26]PIY39829.1 MAG: hypothetical protein COZ03_05230 [Candidatus Aquicultor secundus]